MGSTERLNVSSDSSQVESQDNVVYQIRVDPSAFSSFMINSRCTSLCLSSTFGLMIPSRTTSGAKW